MPEMNCSSQVMLQSRLMVGPLTVACASGLEILVKDFMLPARENLGSPSAKAAGNAEVYDAYIQIFD
jgi:hypothetical protein